ncbi:transposase [Streptomyces sp. NPDC057280]|uniref:transposase n=1 Tax=Streptomyces sp. NPDC057280 TaxID=3346081 RepID=UPI00362DACE5
MVDARRVKPSANVAESSQGIDGGKKIKGRERHLITDTLGLVLAVLVTAANVHDTTGGTLLLDDLAAGSNVPFLLVLLGATARVRDGC